MYWSWSLMSSVRFSVTVCVTAVVYDTDDLSGGSISTCHLLKLMFSTLRVGGRGWEAAMWGRGLGQVNQTSVLLLLLLGLGNCWRSLNTCPKQDSSVGTQNTHRKRQNHFLSCSVLFCSVVVHRGWMIDCFYIFVKVIIRLIKNWRKKSFENWIFTKHDLNIWDFRSTPRAHLNYSINISFKKSTTIVSVYR